MPVILALAFIVVPLVELAIVIRVADAISLGPTLVLLVVDSIIGAVLVRREGRRAWRAFKAALEEVRWPGDEVAQGGLILIGGALLLTPGFLTDLVGFVAVLPPTRRALSRLIRRRLTVAGPGGRSRRPVADARVVGVEVIDVQRDDPDGDAPPRPPIA